MWKFRNLPLHEKTVYPTLLSFSVLSFLSLTVANSVHVWPQLDNEVYNWFTKRKKTTSCEKWLQGGVLQKHFPKTFTKFKVKYLCYSLFLILLRTFTPSGLQLYWKENPALVFQNEPFVDHLQNTCSSIIHKIHRKTPMFESPFLINLKSRHSQMVFKIITNFTGK